MLNFYTNVEKWGKHILLRGYNNGVPYNKKIIYKPKLYTETKKSEDFSGLKSVYNKNDLKEHTFENMNESKSFVAQYGEVHGMKIYGNLNYTAQFIEEYFPR